MGKSPQLAMVSSRWPLPPPEPSGGPGRQTSKVLDHVIWYGEPSGPSGPSGSGRVSRLGYSPISIQGTYGKMMEHEHDKY